MAKVLASKEIIKSIVNLEVAPLLKQEAFRKTAFTFVRRRGRTGQLIQIQLSSWNRGSEGAFFVNVGLMFDQMWRGGSDPPRYPRYDDCHFMVRLERIAPNAPSEWSVDATTFIPEASAKLVAHLREPVLSRMALVCSVEDFEQTGWIGAIPWGFPALFAYALGRDDEAASLVQAQAAYFKDRGVTAESLIEAYGFARLQRQGTNVGRSREVGWGREGR
ncbi:DUF4304 domain-containing protein [Luteimonas sp. RD2P54]|uniref:DUF4304 domain-containing protein n=1 Tax=Luteimonas endophytica TaxID=3042023 RepID=A0ABT6JDR6_9GAMM|nr:DUF4304 domain-containing protein [Luteimonas endophytica]MDH5824970.1 DUF4304 domain-containing protein [Luteimonas endophytica]